MFGHIFFGHNSTIFGSITLKNIEAQETISNSINIHRLVIKKIQVVTLNFHFSIFFRRDNWRNQ